MQTEMHLILHNDSEPEGERKREREKEEEKRMETEGHADRETQCIIYDSICENHTWNAYIIILKNCLL